jgi:hypothetical protein
VRRQLGLDGKTLLFLLVSIRGLNAFISQPRFVLDATRVSDAQQVIIKMLLPEGSTQSSHELAILQRFSKAGLAEDGDNHAIPCLESFDIPDVAGGKFLVTPLIVRRETGGFQHLNEVRELLNQTLKVRRISTALTDFLISIADISILLGIAILA